MRRTTNTPISDGSPLAALPWWLSALVLLPLVWSTDGCSGDDGGGTSPPPGACVADLECPDESFCLVLPGERIGRCTEGCRMRPDNCPEGQRCVELGGLHSCQDRSGEGEGEGEDRCGSDRGCPEGTWCRAEDGACVPGCRLEPDDCPEGHHCVEEGGEHLCQEDETEGCQGDGDCDPGDHCLVEEATCVQCLDDRHCGSDELCVEHRCEPACPPAGCDEGFTCDRETRTCYPDDCRTAPDSCPGGTICCPGTGRCEVGECAGPECCGGLAGCIEASHQRCHDWYALNYYCRDDDTCGLLTCASDQGCPEDSWCDLTSEPGTCKLGCREGGCDGRMICDPTLHRCVYPPCQVDEDCESTPEDPWWCQEGRCAPGCGDDEACGPGMRCDQGNHACEPWLCPGGDGDCPDLPWPDGYYCDSEQAPPRCLPGCRGDEACPEGMPCRGDHRCGCRDAGDCPEGSVCEPDGRCRALCRTNHDCPDGWCDPTGRCLPGCLTDPNEPDDSRLTATMVPPVGEAYQGLTLCRGDQDWFSVFLRDGDGLEATLTMMTPDDGWVVLEAYHPDSDLALPVAVSTNDPGDRVATLSLPGAMVNVTGAYMVRVVALSTEVEVLDYDLTITPTRGRPWCPADRAEGPMGNDSPIAAAVLDEGEHQGLTLCAMDEDWFRFQLGQGAVFAAQVLCEGDHRVRVDFLDADLQVLDFSDGWCNNVIHHQVALPGVYYLKVAHGERAEQEEIMSYDLTVDIRGGGPVCPVDEFEPNDRQDGAPALPDLHEGDNLFPGLTLCGTDTDWFLVPPICPMALLTASIRFSHEDGDLDLVLLGPDGQSEQSAGFGDTESVTMRGQAAQEHWIMVYSEGEPDATYDLTVTVTCEVCEDDPFDDPPGNDTRDRPGQVELASHLPDLAMCRDDEDWYRLDLPDASNLRVQLCFHQMACDLDFDLYSPTGELLTHDCQGCPGHSTTDNECLLVQEAAPGQYLLRVAATEGSMTCDYGLLVEAVSDESTCPGPEDRRCPAP